MAVDLADYSQGVVVQSGSVTISGIATVSISGTPAVTVSGTPNVSIANVPAVTISSGSVTIANASIGVINAAGTKITSSRPPQILTTQLLGSGATNTATSPVLPNGIQALVLVLGDALPGYVHIKVAWSGLATITWLPLELFNFTQSVYVVPILPSALNSTGSVDTTLDVTLQSKAGFAVSLQVWALFESAPEWLTLFPQPHLSPNQPANLVTVANPFNFTAVIAPVANVSITLFALRAIMVIAGSAVLPAGQIVSFGHGPTAAAVTYIAQYSTGLNAVPAGQTVSLPDLVLDKGSIYPVGDGIWVLWSNNNAAGGVNQAPVYSLS